MSEVTVLQAIADLYPWSGGIARVVVDSADALARQRDLSVTLMTQAVAGSEILVSSCPQVELVVAESASRAALAFGLPFRRELVRLCRTARPSLIHNHGLWVPLNHWAGSMGRRIGIPVIVQPHGMLEPWALNHKAWKKKLAMALFQRRDLEFASLLVATSSVEYENIRKLGLRQPVAIIPNGVDLPTEAFQKTVLLQDRQRVALFLSRVHPVKGLFNLVQAWARLAPVGWRLCIAGPDEAGHLKEIMSLVHQLGMQDSIEYVGPVLGAAKSALYNAADVFVLPTFTENFGVVIAEALAHGLPVITTRGAPWADLEKFRCGWWVGMGVDPLVHALREAMALGDDQRSAIGARGREYVRRYDWDDIALQTINVYRWVLGQGPAPECVRMS
ncbi:glycosyltransferase [Casimicrobium huifangae]|uniref:glycosyltransferase n=1 Tax=Casimicrobium huifangae TaxID=2591109 RepID=UPI001396A210|nr:glycosyltransferase [Casimicrobium huifangae]